MATSGTPAIALRITRTYPHPRDKIFQAWTEAQAMSRWFAPTDDYQTLVPVLDAKPGGSYRIEMRHKDGNTHVVTGKYLEVKRPERLVFTWKWEDPGAEETQVTIEFREQGQNTELILSHEKFEAAEARDKHEQGWSGCLSRLENALTASSR